MNSARGFATIAAGDAASMCMVMRDEHATSRNGDDGINWMTATRHLCPR
jgi:hypothetical protein